MQVIGLIGYVDKYDMILNLARAINIMDKSVLVVDATLDRKLKYIVPALDNIGRAYVLNIIILTLLLDLIVCTM